MKPQIKKDNEHGVAYLQDEALDSHYILFQGGKMVKINLSNHNPNSKYKKMLVDISTGRCVLDDNHEINLRHIHETDFNHPLLNQPFKPRKDSIYQYSYEDIDSFLYSTIFVMGHDY